MQSQWGDEASFKKLLKNTNFQVLREQAPFTISFCEMFFTVCTWYLLTRLFTNRWPSTEKGLAQCVSWRIHVGSSSSVSGLVTADASAGKCWKRCVILRFFCSKTFIYYNLNEWQILWLHLIYFVPLLSSLPSCGVLLLPRPEHDGIPLPVPTMW